MPTFTGTQKAAGPDIQDGYYESKITGAEQVDGQYGPQIQVQYQIPDRKNDYGEPIEFRDWYTIPTDKETGEFKPIRVTTKLGQLFSAACFKGEPYPEDTDLDTDDLIGKWVLVNWGEYISKQGLKKVGVISVKASRRAKAVVGAAPVRKARPVILDDDEDDDLTDQGA